MRSVKLAPAHFRHLIELLIFISLNRQCRLLSRLSVAEHVIFAGTTSCEKDCYGSVWEPTQATAVTCSRTCHATLQTVHSSNTPWGANRAANFLHIWPLNQSRTFNDLCYLYSDYLFSAVWCFKHTVCLIYSFWLCCASGILSVSCNLFCLCDALSTLSVSSFLLAEWFFNHTVCLIRPEIQAWMKTGIVSVCARWRNLCQNRVHQRVQTKRFRAETALAFSLWKGIIERRKLAEVHRRKR